MLQVLSGLDGQFSKSVQTQRRLIKLSHWQPASLAHMTNIYKVSIFIVKVEIYIFPCIQFPPTTKKNQTTIFEWLCKCLSIFDKMAKKCKNTELNRFPTSLFYAWLTGTQGYLPDWAISPWWWIYDIKMLHNINLLWELNDVILGKKERWCDMQYFTSRVNFDSYIYQYIYIYICNRTCFCYVVYTYMFLF